MDVSKHGHSLILARLLFSLPLQLLHLARRADRYPIAFSCVVDLKEAFTHFALNETDTVLRVETLACRTLVPVGTYRALTTFA